MTVNPSGNTAMINGNLFMAGNPVYFHIADGPADPDLLINAAMSGTSSIQKDGPGMLALNGASTFSGALFINDGIVNVMYDLALGSSAIGSGTIVRNGATLHLAPGV